MTFRHVFGENGNPDHWYIDGIEVTEADFNAALTPPVNDGRVIKDKGKVDPWRNHRSEGAAVHPNQRQEARDSAARRGVPTDFDRHGRPKFTSRTHQRRYLKAYGFHNRDDN